MSNEGYRVFKGLGDIITRLARNPLGVLYLPHLVMAAILACSSSLGGDEQVPIVWFLVLYPVVLLGVLYWLVTRHHSKLYAPSDFVEEKNFVDLVNKQIATSPTIQDLEAIMERVRVEILDQPMYRYAALPELGKQLALSVIDSKEFDCDKWAQERKLDRTKVEEEIERLLSYGWATRSGSAVHLTEKGEREILSFLNFIYGRYAPYKGK